ncbi:hypothetical protein [Haladaptatus sp. DYF46]|uniref:hypothetical protein n=1 Tax=Haladaptatus sp. DYF46 TaxID=2886041 RepID=UPI001E652497|nr:hypothetical protein [Haladaptatus sp. DYF46]
MSTAFRDALYERLTLRTLLSWLTMLAIFWIFLDSTIPQLAIMTLTAASMGFTDLVSDTYDLRNPVKYSGFGIQMILSGGALLAFEEGTIMLPAIILVIGSWFILNAIQTIRHEGATIPETDRDGHDVYRNYVAGRLYDILKERPQTRRELDESLDADYEVLDAAINQLLDRDTITQNGSEFRLATSPDPNGLTRIQEWTTGMLQRIARPLSLELEQETSNHNRVDRDSTRVTPVERENDSFQATNTRTDHDRPDSQNNGTSSNREQEPESVR